MMKTRLLAAAFVTGSIVTAFAQSGQSAPPGSTGTGVTANVSPETHCIDPTTGQPRLRTGSGSTFIRPADMGNTRLSTSSGPTSGRAGMTVRSSGAPGCGGVGTKPTGTGAPGSAGPRPASGPGSGATTGSSAAAAIAVENNPGSCAGVPIAPDNGSSFSSTPAPTA